MAKQARWLFSISPTKTGLMRHPNWQAIPGPVAVYTRAELDQRKREARAAKRRGEITGWSITPVPNP